MTEVENIAFKIVEIDSVMVKSPTQIMINNNKDFTDLHLSIIRMENAVEKVKSKQQNPEFIRWTHIIQKMWKKYCHKCYELVKIKIVVEKNIRFKKRIENIFPSPVVAAADAGYSYSCYEDKSFIAVAQKTMEEDPVSVLLRVEKLQKSIDFLQHTFLLPVKQRRLGAFEGYTSPFPVTIFQVWGLPCDDVSFYYRTPARAPTPCVWQRSGNHIAPTTARLSSSWMSFNDQGHSKNPAEAYYNECKNVWESYGFYGCDRQDSDAWEFKAVINGQDTIICTQLGAFVFGCIKDDTDINKLWGSHKTINIY